MMREMSDAAGGEREADTVPGPLRKPIHFFIFFFLKLLGVDSPKNLPLDEPWLK